MASSNKKWRRHQGRNPGCSFMKIPHFVLESQQWGALDPIALQLLLELSRQYKGSNNGDLSATPDSLGTRNARWKSRSVLYGRLRMLEQQGWIVKTRQGGKHTGCCLYAISWEAIDPCNGKHMHPVETKASHLWKNAKPVPQRGA